MGFNPLPIAGGIIGGIYGGPSGAAIGYGAGGALSNMFSDSEAPTLSDVNLARDNPELWKELQGLEALVGEYDRQYAQRKQGATAGELAGVAEGRGHYAEQLGNLGLTGSTAGAQLQGAHEAKMQDALMNRIAQERQQLLAQLFQAKQAYASAFANGQQGVLASLQGRANAHNQDQESQNQFYSGIGNAGLRMLGNENYIDYMNGGNQAPVLNTWGNPAYNPGYYDYQNPGNGWMNS